MAVEAILHSATPRALFTAVLILVAAGCGRGAGDSTATVPEVQKVGRNAPRAEQVASKLESYLEHEAADDEDIATPFCEVTVVGVGAEGITDAVHGTPVYTHAWCDQYEPKDGDLHGVSGWRSEIRFIVSDIDGDAFKVLDDRRPLDGADNDPSLRNLFPATMYEKVRSDPTGQTDPFERLGCDAVKRARSHFDLPDAKVTGGSNPCNPPT